MLTIGVDLAASPDGTAACWIKWAEARARAYRLEQPVGDNELLEYFEAGDKVGIDVPFGWPDAFVDALSAHGGSDRESWPRVDRKFLCFRETDRFVHQQIGRWPLSVSSDRIAVPAIRAAGLFSRFQQRKRRTVDREGTGTLVEVYPRAALMRWGFDASRYRGPRGREARRSLLAAIGDRTRSWLDLEGTLHEMCGESADALDALIAALAARAQAQNLCEPIPDSARGLASKEGWIALPKAGSLESLPLDP